MFLDTTLLINYIIIKKEKMITKNLQNKLIVIVSQCLINKEFTTTEEWFYTTEKTNDNRIVKVDDFKKYKDDIIEYFKKYNISVNVSQHKGYLDEIDFIYNGTPSK